MINIKELRIGVYIHSQDKGIQLIESGEEIETITLYSDTQDYSPIPLTEEWLLKFGAVEIVKLNDGYKRFNLDGIQLSISPVDRDWFVEYVHQIPIKYVHTLQNFYFATKQVELEPLTIAPAATLFLPLPIRKRL